MNPVVTYVLGGTYSTTQNSDAVSVARSQGVAASISYTGTTAVAAVFNSGVAQVDTLTMATKVLTGAGDFVKIRDGAGGVWAVAANKLDVKTVTFPTKAAATAADYIHIKDVTGGDWAVALNKSGTDAAPTGARWVSIPAANKAFVNISAVTTATQVAGLAFTALQALVGFTSAVTLTNPADGTLVFTAPSFGLITAFFPHNADDSGVGSITVVNTSVGGPSPAGALWSSVPAANKVVVDITTATTAATVATAVQAGLAGLTGISTTLTVGASSGANIPITQVIRLLMGDPTPSNAGETAIGSITVAQTTAGVTATVDTTANTITMAAHGFVTGLKGRLTTTGTLPTGLSTGIDYFVIVIDANTVKLASSLDNALAGTAVVITSQGTSGGVNTFTPTALSGGSVKLQQSVNKTDWFDISGQSASIATTGTSFFNVSDLYAQYVRAVFTATAGQVQISAAFCTKDM